MRLRFVINHFTGDGWGELLLIWICAISTDFWLCLPDKLSSGSRNFGRVHWFWSYKSNRRSDWWLTKHADASEVHCAPHVYIHGLKEHSLGLGIYFSSLRDISIWIWCGFLLRTLAWAGMSLLSTIYLLSALHLKHSLWVLITHSYRRVYLPPKCFTVFWLKLWGSAHTVFALTLGVRFLMSCDNRRDFIKPH